MTATPIPRTLALILYGDLDISIIDELPPNRKKIETYAVTKRMEQRVNDFIRKNINEGRQAYVVCPLVEEKEEEQLQESSLEYDFEGIQKSYQSSEEKNQSSQEKYQSSQEQYQSSQRYEQKNNKPDLKAVKQWTEIYQNQIFPEYKVACIYGKMKQSEKEEIMENFKNGKIDILISTTVIEVGVNVPNASIMVVENADRFGLAQLHQLRGRVGRGEYQSYCILKYNSSSGEIGRERMKTMQETNDGFIIAEKDLELRGTGEFFRNKATWPSRI